MAVFNGERFLEQAVASVLNQTLPDLELIVLDDGSTDRTPELLDELSLRDPRVVVHRHPNRGRTASLNAGVRYARAPLVARLDADDVCLPTRLARQREFLDRHERVALVGGAVRLIDDGGRAFEESRYPVSDAEIRTAFTYTTPFVHSSVMFRRSAFDKVGGYRECFAETEDLDLWLRLAEHHELANLPEAVIEYRLHADQATVRKLEFQTLCLVAARLSARARAESRPDPLDGVDTIDQDWLLSQGIDRREIVTATVKSAAWLAGVMGRAGYTEQADALLAGAEVHARSEPRQGTLLAEVYRARAKLSALQGRNTRAWLERGRALLAGRLRDPRSST
jgi:glycosyltransferase involved in cell wall biosynthesis